MEGQDQYYNCPGYNFSELTNEGHPNRNNNAIKQKECYKKDFFVNCQGNCLRTADGTQLENKAPFTVLACPANLAFGTRIYIEGVGETTCHDRGGKIKGKRLDLWAGIGDEGLKNIRTVSNGGLRNIYLIK